MVGSIEPRPIVWENIKAAIGQSGEQAPLVLPEAAAAGVAAIEEAMAATEEAGPAPVYTPPPPPVVDETNVVRLDRRVRAYRNLAMAMTAIAAALLAIIGVQVAAFRACCPGPWRQTRHAGRRGEADACTRTCAGARRWSRRRNMPRLLQGAAGGGPPSSSPCDGATKNFTMRKAS